MFEHDILLEVYTNKNFVYKQVTCHAIRQTTQSNNDHLFAT